MNAEPRALDKTLDSPNGALGDSSETPPDSPQADSPSAPETPEVRWRETGAFVSSAAFIAAKTIADIMFGHGLRFEIPLPPVTKGEAARRRTIEEQKSELVKHLLASGIDPFLFDTLLSNEMDRRLKTRFGVAFLVLTFLFTGVSYAIVILNGINQWGISNIAITGLIIETPLQFIGLLYIIARNLFPTGKRATIATAKRRSRATTKQANSRAL